MSSDTDALVGLDCAPRRRVYVVEGLAQLIELQVLDAALAKAESDLGKLPDARAACAAKREAAEARMLEAKEGLVAAEGTQRGSF